MGQKDWMQESVDARLLFLLCIRKLWIVFLAMAAGAAAAGGLYIITHVIYAPAREYRAQHKYYLEFEVDENGDVYQHYNDYTWNTMMQTDEILGYTVSLLGDVPADVVAKAVFVEPLSDIRLLVVDVTTTDEELTQRIAQATEQSMLHFVEVMKEFRGVKVMQRTPAALVVADLDTFRVAIAGAVAGFAVSVLSLFLYFVLDDSIYIPLTFQKRYGYLVLGTVFGHAGEGAAKEAVDAYLLACRYAALRTERPELPETLNLDKISTVIIKDLKAQTKIDYGKLRETGQLAIIEVPCGQRNGRLIAKQIAELLNRGFIIAGAVMTEADARLYAQYYRMRRADKI